VDDKTARAALVNRHNVLRRLCCTRASVDRRHRQWSPKVFVRQPIEMISSLKLWFGGCCPFLLRN